MELEGIDEEEGVSEWSPANNSLSMLWPQSLTAEGTDGSVQRQEGLQPWRCLLGGRQQ